VERVEWIKHIRHFIYIHNTVLKQLFTASLQHIRQTFSIITYGLCFVMIGIACWLNYSSLFPLWPSHSSFPKVFLFLTGLFIVFLGSGVLFTLPGKKASFNFNGTYKWILVLAPIVFALKVALPFDDWLLHTIPVAYVKAFQRPAEWLGGLLFMIPALLLLHFYFEKKWNLFFVKKTTNYQPYFILLLGMIPLLVLAAQQNNFQQVYPRAKDVTAAFGETATILQYGLFEFCYALDFITIELFFRGLMIAVISRVMGVYGIVPVALFYFSIHLGKPMPEAVSSFFGGLILGAVSYETKSVWGGWMVHCGIAMLMEVLAFLF
jgi:hypothetical protein